MVKDLVTCSRCMKVVERGHKCPYRTYKKKNKDSKVDKFRKTKAWTNKSLEIRQKSKYLCAICMENKYHTINQFNFDKLSVHHIVSLEEDYNKRLDNDNLICLCDYHHKMAEKGDIPREELFELVNKRDMKG